MRIFLACFSIINWNSVFKEWGVENCKDMNEVLMEYKQYNADKQPPGNEKGRSSVKTHLEELSPEQRVDFEERAAIMEYDGGLTKTKAERESIKIIGG